MSRHDGPSIFVPVGILFSAFDNFDLTLLGCSTYGNGFKLEFRVENYEYTHPILMSKYVNTYTEKDFCHMIGRKFTKNDWNPNW